MDVPARRVAGFDELKQPGDFYWAGENSPGRMTFKCPCGCGDVGGIAVKPNPLDRGGNHPVWSWDGNLDKPTVTPSIRFLTGCKWHGFLTTGVFKPC